LRIAGGRRREIGCSLFAGNPAGLAVSAREDRCRLVVENLRSSVSFIGSDFATEATEHTEKEDTLCTASRNHEGREEHEERDIEGHRQDSFPLLSCNEGETGSGLHLAIIGVRMWGAENSRGPVLCRKGSA